MAPRDVRGGTLKRRNSTALQRSTSAYPVMTIAPRRRTSILSAIRSVLRGVSANVTDTPTDHDVAEPDERPHEPDDRNDPGRRDHDGCGRRGRVV
jgi:hypothetical protein